jgi:hypothetical protein
LSGAVGSSAPVRGDRAPRNPQYRSAPSTKVWPSGVPVSTAKLLYGAGGLTVATSFPVAVARIGIDRPSTLLLYWVPPEV